MDEKKISKRDVVLDVLRVVPTQYKLEESKKEDRLTDLLAILFVFGVAFFIRFYVRMIFISNYGDSVFYWQVPENDPLGIGEYTGIAVGGTVNFEGYNDFHYYYIDYVNALLDGWNPYSGSIVEGDHLGGYVYGPLYIYSISFGAYFFDLSAYESIVMGNIIFDSASYVMVYFLAKRVTGNVIALFAATLGSFSPIALFYAGIRGLNAPLMNFLALLYLYYFLERKDGRAMLVLAMATMTKQFPLFFALPVGFWMMRRYGIIKGMGFILLYIFDALVIGLPWIIMDPKSFIIRLFLPGGGKNYITCPAGGETANLVHGGLVQVCEQFPDQLVPVDQIPTYVQVIFALINYPMFGILSGPLFFGLIFILGWLGFTAYDYLEKDHKYYFKFTAAFYTIVHATIARGIYKYYLTMLIPFLILAFIPGHPEKSFNIRIGAMINRYYSRLFDPRNRAREATISYWIMFLSLLLSLLSIYWVIDATIMLFTNTTQYRNFLRLVITLVAVYSIIKPNCMGMEKTDEKVDFTDINNKLPIMLIIFAVLFNYLSKVARIYFNSSNDLQINLYIMIGIVFLFAMLSQIEKLYTKSDTTFKYYNLQYYQLILDIIGLFIGFIVINFFTIQILTVNRLLTTTVVFIMGIILMGMLEVEIWSSFFKVPISALKKLRILISENVDNKENST